MTNQVKTRIVLSMIVKDESPVIDRCLSSVMPFVDEAIIFDTGSTDDTIEKIETFFTTGAGRNKDWSVYERPWVNFAHNRNEALDIARSAGDYVLFIDADEVLSPPPDPRKPMGALTADGYMFMCQYGGWSYRRNAMVKSSLPWRWVGVLHEYLTCDEAHTWATLDNPKILVSHDGARSRDPATYQKDIDVLRAALVEEPLNARYRFYLAQSCKDAGDYRSAQTEYHLRAGMAQYPEEQWFAAYQYAAMCERLETAPMVLLAYLDAQRMRPWRAEPLHALARYCRLNGDYEMAAIYAGVAAKVPYPKQDRLFIDDSVYKWRCLDELGISGYYSKAPGARAAGLAAAKAALRAAPASEHDRLTRNVASYAKSSK